ncbi:MAG TPA: ABC transporter permease [Alphaproteobacteria bacterium]|jgi:ABC-type nitrate/sulfonate/bicarbonate transport system permease component|nr:ABC transporter permease [Alphaproteobacteria bacterium]
MTAAATALAAARPRLRLPGGDLAIKILAGVIIAVLWQVLVGAFAPAYVAKPIGIVAAIPDVVTSAQFLEAAWSTLWAVARGLAVAIVVGTVVGLAMGRLRTVDRAFGFYVSGLYAMPMVAVLPLVTLWFGYTDGARMATIVFAAVLSIALNVADGARSVPPEHVEVARSYRARWYHIWFGVTLPAALPYLLAGIRLAAGRALIAAIVSEFFISLSGLGFYILFNSRTFHHDAAFVAVLLLALFGIGIEIVLTWTTRRFMPWYRREDRA